MQYFDHWGFYFACFIFYIIRYILKAYDCPFSDIISEFFLYPGCLKKNQRMEKEGKSWKRKKEKKQHCLKGN